MLHPLFLMNKQILSTKTTQLQLKQHNIQAAMPQTLGCQSNLLQYPQMHVNLCPKPTNNNTIHPTHSSLSAITKTSSYISTWDNRWTSETPGTLSNPASSLPQTRRSWTTNLAAQNRSHLQLNSHIRAERLTTDWRYGRKKSLRNQPHIISRYSSPCDSWKSMGPNAVSDFSTSKCDILLLPQQLY